LGSTAIENPRVDGSIPSQATKFKNPHPRKLVGVLFFGVRAWVARDRKEGRGGVLLKFSAHRDYSRNRLNNNVIFFRLINRIRKIDVH
jgi:hypothetical protein